MPNLTHSKSDKTVIESIAKGFRNYKKEITDILNKVNKRRYEGDRQTVLFLELYELLDRIKAEKSAQAKELKDACIRLIEFCWEFNLSMRTISYLKLQISIQ